LDQEEAEEKFKVRLAQHDVVLMLNLMEWEKQEDKQVMDLVSKSLKNLAHGKELKITHVLPEDFRKHLGEEYISWIPPGSIEVARSRFFCNLANLFTTCTKPGKVLVCLNPEPNKATFTYKYGLSEELGLTYEHFLELIAEGRIILRREARPTRYNADFYREIFDACEHVGYLPFRLDLALRELSTLIKLALIAEKMRIPLEEDWDWEKIVLIKRPEYDIKKIMEDVGKLFDKDTLDVISKEDVLRDPDALLRAAATWVHDLRILGFEKLTGNVSKLANTEKVLAYYILRGYRHHLIEPFMSLFGQQHYDNEDIEIMTFLRVIPNDLSVIWKEEVLAASPASLRLSCDPFETNIVVKPDADEAWRFIKSYEDEEIMEASSSFMRSAKLYDFDATLRNYGKLSQIVQERVNNEHKAWFKRSKRVKASLYMGVGLAASAGAIEGFQKLHWLLKEIPYIYPFLPEVIKRLLKGAKLTADKATVWLVDHWPFAEKGFPFILCKYDIRPEE